MSNRKVVSGQFRLLKKTQSFERSKVTCYCQGGEVEKVTVGCIYSWDGRTRYVYGNMLEEMYWKVTIWKTEKEMEIGCEDDRLLELARDHVGLNTSCVPDSTISVNWPTHGIRISHMNSLTLFRVQQRVEMPSLITSTL
jgi:hypothetical protein